MSPQINPNDYSEIRQIIVDAIEPLKEQLKEIATALKEDYARKDVINPQIKMLSDQLKELKDQVVTTPQKLMMYAGSIVAIIWTLYNLIHSIK